MAQHRRRLIRFWRCRCGSPMPCQWKVHTREQRMPAVPVTHVGHTIRGRRAT